MSVPWWVYLISLPVVLFGLGIHFIPLLAKRLAAADERRKQELIAQGVAVPAEEDVRND
jgi:hypothetical protein